MIKRFLLVLALLIGSALPVEAAVTRGVAGVNNDGLNTQIATVITGTTVGGMIVIVIGYSSYYGPPLTFVSATVSGEADLTHVTAADMTANGDSFAIFYLQNNTGGGSKTVTVTFSDYAYFTSVTAEYLGQDKLSQPDATTTPTTGEPVLGVDPTISITTATAGDLILSICSSNGGKPGMPSGYSDLNLTNPGYFANAADNVAAGAAGAKTLIWGDVTTSRWGVTAVAFKAAVVATGAIRHTVTGQ